MKSKVALLILACPLLCSCLTRAPEDWSLTPRDASSSTPAPSTSRPGPTSTPSPRTSSTQGGGQQSNDGYDNPIVISASYGHCEYGDFLFEVWAKGGEHKDSLIYVDHEGKTGYMLPDGRAITGMPIPDGYYAYDTGIISLTVWYGGFDNPRDAYSKLGLSTIVVDIDFDEGQISPYGSLPYMTSFNEEYVFDIDLPRALSFQDGMGGLYAEVEQLGFFEYCLMGQEDRQDGGIYHFDLQIGVE